MTQLTGAQFGTIASDEFIGQFDPESILADTVGAGISDAQIFSYSADDQVVGEAILIPDASGLTVTGVGIDGSTVATGNGNDTVSAVGFGARFFDGFGLRGPEYSGTGISFGLRDSRVLSGGGDDVLTFAANLVGDTGFERVTSESTGVANSQVFGGTGDDQVTVTGKVGAVDSSIRGENGRDTITVDANNADRGSTGIRNTTISGGSDDDQVAISATGIFDAIAAAESIISGGRGNDDITLDSSSRFPSTRNGFDASVTAFGAFDTVIQGQGGADTIRVSAAGDSSGVEAIALNSSTVNSGSDNDSIILEATGIGLGGTVFAVSDSTVRAGSGDDVVTLVAELLSSSGTAAGASGSLIDGGDGNDVIRVEITATPFNADRSAGIIQSRLAGGLGDDRFEIVAFESNNGGVPDFGMVDGILNGGGGDDTFNVGIGSGRVVGGSGDDLAIVSYLDTQTMTVSEIGGGVQITGTQTNNGRSADWQQRFFSVESFVVGDIAYTAADFVATFGA